MELPTLVPIRPVRREAPFDHPDWLFELKHDGFRALTYLSRAGPRMISRRGLEFDFCKSLCNRIAQILPLREAIMDGELVSLDLDGRSRFGRLLGRRGPLSYCVFDLLWSDGSDLRRLPLKERKSRLREIVPPGLSEVSFLDHVDRRGIRLFHRVCQWNCEGIVAKQRRAPYSLATRWLKIKNPAYSRR